MSGITSRVEWLSPRDANRLLDHNTHNRPLRQSDILKWATEMEAGNWKLNGEAIKIATNGDLLDGQHRLHALALQEDSVKIQFLVVRGLQPEVQTTMDQGRKRSTEDQLNLGGVESDRSVASAIRGYLTYSRGLMWVDRRHRDAVLTVPEMVDWAQRHPAEVELLRQGTLYRKVKARRGLLGTIFAIIAMVHDSDVADEFLSRVQDGVGLEAGSPILALRNRLDQIRGDNRDNVAQKVSERDLMGMFIVAFNAWVSGKTLGKIQRPHGGTWDETTYPRVAKPRTRKF